MERLQSEGIRGADLVFACIGPALEIFSKYSKVETADGCEVKLAEYLEKVWEVVGRIALEQVLGTAEVGTQNEATGVLEEDARLTALFLWTLQTTNGQNGSSDEADDNPEDDTNDEDDEDAPAKSKAKGYSLIFDVVRRFAQPLGIDLPKWDNRIIKIEKGVVRLLPISERAKHLFDEDKADAFTSLLELNSAKVQQPQLFPDAEESKQLKFKLQRPGRIHSATSAGESLFQPEPGATTLDRVHSAMLLQASGQTNALRTLIKSEQERGSDFLRLANALSALYPKDSEEKRLLDAMLLSTPR